MKTLEHPFSALVAFEQAKVITQHHDRIKDTQPGADLLERSQADVLNATLAADLQCQRRVVDGGDAVSFLLQEERVAVVPGSSFGAGGEGFVRCSYATAYEKIEDALTRMERFLGKL